MATKAERSQRAWHKYDESKDHNPGGLQGAVEWAVAEGLIVAGVQYTLGTLRVSRLTSLWKEPLHGVVRRL
jgi:hypothetical protein